VIPLFTTTNSKGIFDIGEERYHHLSFDTPVWGPRIVEITGKITGEPFYVITPDMVRLIPVPELTFSVTLEIVRPGFTLIDRGDVQIQYRESISIQYEETIDIEVYLTGSTDVTVLTSADLISLESATYRGEDIDDNVEISLSTHTEERLIFKVKGINANEVGELRHMISWDDDEELIVTEITTGPAPEEDASENRERNIFGLLFVTVVIGIASLFILKSVKGKEKESERERKRREWLERHKRRKV